MSSPWSSRHYADYKVINRHISLTGTGSSSTGKPYIIQLRVHLIHNTPKIWPHDLNSSALFWGWYGPLSFMFVAFTTNLWLHLDCPVMQAERLVSSLYTASNLILIWLNWSSSPSSSSAVTSTLTVISCSHEHDQKLKSQLAWHALVLANASSLECVEWILYMVINSTKQARLT